MPDIKMSPIENEVFELKVAVNNLHRSMAIGISNLIAVICGVAITFAVMSGAMLVENTTIKLVIIGLCLLSLFCGWLESDAVVTGKYNHPIRVTCIASIVLAILLIILGVL